MNRLVIEPDPAWESLAPALRARLASLATAIDAVTAASILTPVMTGALTLAARCLPAADEILLWMPHGSLLEAAFTTGPDPERVVGSATASLDAGPLAQAFHAQEPLLYEPADLAHFADWTNWEARRGRKLTAVAAAPVRIGQQARGVLAGVSTAAPPGLRHEHLPGLALAASLLGDLIEARLVLEVTGGRF